MKSPRMQPCPPRCPRLSQIGTLVDLKPNAAPDQRSEWEAAQGKLGQECTHGPACHQSTPGLVSQLEGACACV